MLILKAFGQNILTDALSKIFGKILRTIFLALDSIIYSLISYLYRIFTFLSQIRLFENPRMQDLADRVYIIVGVVALFLVAYALISAIINPDNATKGKNSSFSGIVKNLIFAIIGIAIVPSVFDYAYEFQNRILCSNVINKFFAVPTGTEDEGTNFSNEMALTLFQSFYYVKQTDGSSENNKNLYNGVNSDDGEMTLTDAFEFINKGDKSIFEALGDFDDAFDNGQLGYLYLVSTVAGLYCAYVLLGFVIDIAVRSVKLSYLQLVAPLPIMTLVIPNQKKVFDNWLKKATSCFLEVFVRVIAIAFAAYSVRYLPEYVFSNKMPTCNGGISGIILLLAKAAFIIGIFGFLKQAPKLIGELFPGFDSKGFKLGFKDSFAEVGGFRALGAAGGFASSAVKNAAISGSRAYRNTNGPFKQQNKLAKFANGALAVAAGGAAGVAGAVAGGVKGGYKGFNSAKDAKKWSDSKSAASKAAEEVIENRMKKDEWNEANNDGKMLWRVRSHGKEAIDKVKQFVSADEAQYKHLQTVLKPLKETSDAQKMMTDASKKYVENHEKDIIVDTFKYEDADGHKLTANNTSNLSLKQLRIAAEDAAKVASSSGNINDIRTARVYQNAYDAARKKAEMGALSGKYGTNNNGPGKNEIDGEIFSSIQTYYSNIKKNRDIILNNSGLKKESQEYKEFEQSLDAIIKLDLSKKTSIGEFRKFEDQLKRKITGTDKEVGSFIATSTAKNNVSAEANALLDKINEQKEKK